MTLRNFILLKSFFLLGDVFAIHFLGSAWMNYGGAQSRGNVCLIFEMVEVVS